MAINGQTVLSMFDIFAAAGGENIAIQKTFPVSVTGGQIDITTTTVTDSPQLNALEIYPAAEGGPCSISSAEKPFRWRRRTETLPVPTIEFERSDLLPPRKKCLGCM